MSKIGSRAMKFSEEIIDWYKKKTSDMIFPISVSPAIVPGGRIVVNGGNVENTGIALKRKY